MSVPDLALANHHLGAQIRLHRSVRERQPRGLAGTNGHLDIVAELQLRKQDLDSVPGEHVAGVRLRAVAPGVQVGSVAGVLAARIVPGLASQAIESQAVRHLRIRIQWQQAVDVVLVHAHNGALGQAWSDEELYRLLEDAAEAH